MNTAIIALVGLTWFVIAYMWYGNVIRDKLFGRKIDFKTPANTQKDGKDFIPTKPFILFGHHFSSIAGAGPIVGPIIAFAWFGWLPAILWILVGAVFMGAVHDYTSLMVSVRHKGVSIVEVCEKVVSKRASNIFGVFVWLTLTLILAVFADLTAKTLINKPEIVIPTFGIMLIAVIFGFLVFKMGWNWIPTTITALAALFGLILLGETTPVNVASIFEGSGLESWLGQIFTEGNLSRPDYHFWLLISFVYCFIASIIPVWILLQPRDYLSMYILVIGLVLGFAGLLFLQPEINAPAMTSINSQGGPVFPMLFIVVACGALSGFHSLVASGTTAKQLDKPKDGKLIAFGGMLMEGVLGFLVVLMISSVLHWSPEGNGQLSFQGLLSESPNIVFGTALGKTIESLGINLSIGIAFGVLMLNAFILTSLDTCSRLSRYIVQETLGKKYGGVFKGKAVATLASLVVAYLLCLTDGYKTIWPVFGASNQLIATLALFIVSVYFLGKRKPVAYTLIPAVIMLIVTESALVYQIIWKYFPQGNWILLTISIVLFFLGLAVALEVLNHSKRIKLKLKSEGIV